MPPLMRMRTPEFGFSVVSLASGRCRCARLSTVHPGIRHRSYSTLPCDSFFVGSLRWDPTCEHRLRIQRPHRAPGRDAGIVSYYANEEVQSSSRDERLFLTRGSGQDECWLTLALGEHSPLAAPVNQPAQHPGRGGSALRCSHTLSIYCGRTCSMGLDSDLDALAVSLWKRRW